MVVVIVENCAKEIEIPARGDVFNDVIALLKKYGGRFDPSAKVWRFGALPSALVNELARFIDIKDVGDCIADAVLVGNYYLVPSQLAGRVNYDALKYTVRKYDPDEKEFYEEEVKLWVTKEDGSVLVPRGLAKSALPSMRFQLFAPWLDPKKVIEKAMETGGFRDYQAEVIGSIADDFKVVGASTVWMATGGGKSYMSAGLIKVLQSLYPNKIKKVYYLSMSIDLALQFREFAEKWGLKVGVVTGEEKDWSKSIVAATAQTLYRAITAVLNEKNGNDEDVDAEIKPYLDVVELDKKEMLDLAGDYEKADLVIIDEVQHLPARTVKTVAKFNKRAIRLAMSATPWRNDGKDLEIYAWAGEITRRKVTSSELIKRGYLVPAYIFMWKRYMRDECVETYYSMKGTDATGAQRFSAVKRCVFDDPDRDADIIEVAEALPKPLLLLTKEVEPAKRLHKQLLKNGLKAELVIGAVKGEKRRAIFDRVEKLDVLVADTVADEGLDLPPIMSLLITGGGMSKTRTLQRVGRVVRPWKDKKYAIVVDLWDLGPYFEDHGEERLNLYRTEPLWRVFITNTEELFQKLNGLLRS
jgi:superfamily II DNA or RNA helicase